MNLSFSVYLLALQIKAGASRILFTHEHRMEVTPKYAENSNHCDLFQSCMLFDELTMNSLHQLINSFRCSKKSDRL